MFTPTMVQGEPKKRVCCFTEIILTFNFTRRRPLMRFSLLSLSGPSGVYRPGSVLKYTCEVGF